MPKSLKIFLSLFFVANIAFIHYSLHTTTTQLNKSVNSLQLNYAAEHVPPPTKKTITEENKPFNDLKKSIHTIRPFTVESGHHGTGILIEKNIILTAWHVLKNRYKEIPKEEWSDVVLHVQKNGFNDSAPNNAKLMAYDKDHDIALIKAEDLDCPCVPLYDGAISYEETVYSAYRLSTVLTEIITQGRFINKLSSIIYSNNPLYLGASGGGILIKRSDEFRLIGTIISMPLGITRKQGKWPLNFITISTPAEKAIELLNNTEKHLVSQEKTLDNQE